MNARNDFKLTCENRIGNIKTESIIKSKNKNIFLKKGIPLASRQASRQQNH
jgi:hypothetical protein